MAKQILIVDDDPSTVKYLSVVLSEHGYEPVSASNGSEGLRRVRQVRPDMIVLDVMMPKKSGLVLLKQLKGDAQFKDIPVLMLTGLGGTLEELEEEKDDTEESSYDSLREALKHQMREMREQGLLRPEMFMDKPIAHDVFIAKVEELLGD
jgi:CheY-like chemotaxis protein